MCQGGITTAAPQTSRARLAGHQFQAAGRLSVACKDARRADREPMTAPEQLEPGTGRPSERLAARTTSAAVVQLRSGFHNNGPVVISAPAAEFLGRLMTNGPPWLAAGVAPATRPI